MTPEGRVITWPLSRASWVAVCNCCTRSKDVKLEVEDCSIGPGKEQYLHTLTCGPEEVQPTVVMMPGYGAGVGFYYRCAMPCYPRLHAHVA